MIPLKVDTAQQWLQDSKANLRQREELVVAHRSKIWCSLLSKPDQKLCIYAEISPQLFTFAAKEVRSLTAL